MTCRLFGHCRQAYYQCKADIASEMEREKQLLKTVKEIREDDPGIGGYKLWLMLTGLFGRDYVPGRDAFFTFLRRNHLMLPPRKTRHTTNSNHRYHKWKNRIKGLAVDRPNMLWVSDITYIVLENGNVCYLHLITDAYSHKIIGWMLADTLRAAITIQALEQAIREAVLMTGSDCLKGLTHHSDRGVQYCCDAYVEKLQKHGIAISMTEGYKPTDNAIAERVNGIIKVENIYSRHRFNSLEHAWNVIERYIHFYNFHRPHMSIGYKTPAQVHLEQGEQKKMWKNKTYKKQKQKEEEKGVSLSCQTTGSGESVRR